MKLLKEEETHLTRLRGSHLTSVVDPIHGPSSNGGSPSSGAFVFDCLHGNLIPVPARGMSIEETVLVATNVLKALRALPEDQKSYIHAGEFTRQNTIRLFAD